MQLYTGVYRHHKRVPTKSCCFFFFGGGIPCCTRELNTVSTACWFNTLPTERHFHYKDFLNIFYANNFSGKHITELVHGSVNSTLHSVIATLNCWQWFNFFKTLFYDIIHVSLQITKLQAAIKYGEEDLPGAKVCTVLTFVSFLRLFTYYIGCLLEGKESQSLHFQLFFSPVVFTRAMNLWPFIRCYVFS